MADLKLSDIRTASPASALTGAEPVYTVQGGASVATTAQEIAELAPAGTVTSVALSAPAEFSVGGSPVTESGTLALTWASQAAAKVLASPATGGSAAPNFRAIAPTDLPVAPAITTVTWASTITIDLTGAPRGAIFRCTLAGNTTVNITGGTDGQMAVIELTQDATGSRLVTLGSGFGFGTDVTGYTASTAAGKTDVLGVIYNSAATKYRLLLAVKGY